MSAVDAPAAPSTRRRGRRIAGWSAFAVALILVAGVGALLAGGGWSARDALDPESAGPDGTRAVVRILQQQGIDVRIARDRDAAMAALTAGPATLALPDAPALSDDRIRELADAATAVVLLEPRSRSLRVLLPGSTVVGATAGTTPTATCGGDLAATGPVTIGDLYSPGEGVTGCYPADDAYGLLRGGGITALDARTVLANDALDAEGNAALALRVLGGESTLVWYVPSLADADGAAPTLGELTPAWVTPAILLLALAGIIAAVWRGRRFGPLVSETLPVTVRASETTIGRGRLYAHSGDRGHAAAQLRRAASTDLARRLALGPRARPIEIADAVAALTGADRGAVLDDLAGPPPADDRALVTLDQRLRALDSAVRAALRPPSTDGRPR